jgi:hypothetical protein
MRLAILFLLCLLPCAAHQVEPGEPGNGTLNGQVFDVANGDLEPARNAQGHLILCEPVIDSKPPIDLDTRDWLPWIADHAPDACAFFFFQLALLGENRPESADYSVTRSVFEGVLEYARIHHLRDVPFRTDARGIFSVSTIKGSYLVYVNGLVRGHRCIWLRLGGVHVGKRPVSIKLSSPASVGPDSPPLLTTPNLILHAAQQSKALPTDSELRIGIGDQLSAVSSFP